MGQLLDREELKRLAIVMYRSCGQMIDPYGSLGEQIQHTNFAMRGKMDDVFAMRGGYSEDWVTLWLAAYFLEGAAHLMELGVPIW
jgi:hypothetical protein